MRAKTLRLTLIVAAVAGVIGGGYYGRFNGRAVDPATGGVSPAASAASPPAGSMILPDFSSIVAQNGPAVVNISVSGSSKVGSQDSAEPDSGDPFADFFGRFQAPMPQGEMPVRGLGSGFIVRPDGVIITSAHVIDGASGVTVKLTDKREFQAKVIGIDKATDMAVLKIDAHGLPAVRLGDPAQLRVGEWVLAIGSPFGFENSVTAGIISAKSRSLPDEGYVPFIQTDVAVNPGNSGGPLFNVKGEVIGINSQIYSRTGGYQGVSFAVPIDVALKVEQQLLDNGRVTRGRLGVGIQDLNQALADSFGLEKPSGALVGSVSNDGPAAAAGLQPGDVILKLNGNAIDDSSQLPPQVADLKPGSQARLSIWRNGRSLDIALRVGETEDAKPMAAASLELAKGRLGLTVRPLAPQDSRQDDVDGGLLVEQVAGPAARAGIRPGDVVLAVNGHPVADAEQLQELTAKVNKRIALLVQRGALRLFVPIDLG